MLVDPYNITGEHHVVMRTKYGAYVNIRGCMVFGSIVGSGHHVRRNSGTTHSPTWSRRLRTQSLVGRSSASEHEVRGVTSRISYYVPTPAAARALLLGMADAVVQQRSSPFSPLYS